MIKLIYSDKYDKRLWITPSIQRLVSQINHNNVEISLGRIGDSQFIRDNPSSNPQSINKPLYAEEEQVLRIKYKILPGAVADSLKNIARVKSISNYNFLHCREIYQDNFKEIYIYKRPGFNEAFLSLKKMLPDFTEEEFARIGVRNNYNHNLILESEVELPNQELLRIMKIIEETKHYEITLNIIGSSIESDFKSILNILQICDNCII